jgi:TPR repeat protein
VSLQSKNSFDLSMPLIRQSAKAGFSRAQSLLGNCLLLGNYGFARDVEIARKWLILAAQKDAEGEVTD